MPVHPHTSWKKDASSATWQQPLRRVTLTQQLSLQPPFLSLLCLTLSAFHPSLHPPIYFSLSFPSWFPSYWFPFTSPPPLSPSVNHYPDSSICIHFHWSHQHTHTHTHTRFNSVPLSAWSCSLMLSLSVSSLLFSTLFTASRSLFLHISSETWSPSSLNFSFFFFTQILSFTGLW